MLAQQPRFAGNASLPGAQGKGAACGGHGDMLRPHVGSAAFLQAAQTLFLAGFVIQLPADAPVVREEAAAVLRHRVHQLVLGGLDPLNGMESIQVLGPHAGQHAIARMHQAAHLLDVPHMPRAHFRHKHLMGGLQLRADDFRHAHGGIVAGGRHQRLILFGQQRTQDELHAGLAKAARNADFDQVRAFPQHPLRVAEIHLGNQLLNGPGAQPRQRHPQGQQQRKQPD